MNHVFDGRDGFFLQAFNIDAFLDVFSDMQVDRLWVQQVHDLLVVNFKVTRFHKVLDLTALQFLFCLLTFYRLEDVLKGSLHDAPHFELVTSAVLARDDCIVSPYLDVWSLDRKGLARSSLAIGEDRAVVAQHAAVGDGLGDLGEDLLL